MDNFAVDITVPDGQGYLDQITNPAMWPVQVWGVLGALAIILVLRFLWNNIDDKIKIALVAILAVGTIMYFYTT